MTVRADVTQDPVVTRVMPVSMVAQSTCRPPLQRQRNAEANLVLGGSFFRRPSVTLRTVFTFHCRPVVPENSPLVTRNVFSALHINQTGNILPTFQYRISKKPVVSDAASLLNLQVERTAGLKSELMPCEATIFGPVAFRHEMRTEIKAKSKVTPRPSLIFNTVFTFKQGSGIGRRQTLPIRSRPVMRSGVVSLQPRLSVDYALKPCLWARARVMAPLTGPGGNLTVITGKKRLRVIPTVHPDSKGFDQYGEPKRKKYFWRLVATPEGLPACACEFIHIGYYDIRNGVWGFNEDRPVVLMVPDTELVFRKFGFPPEPVLFPQFNENGDARVVMVRNLMYDINSPRAFVRTEFVGWPPSAVEKLVIQPEFVRMVVVHEGCGGSFFLINAECQ